MTCNEAWELLSAHIDGETTPEQEEQLQAHLAECPDCRKLLQAYEQLDGGIAALTEPAPEGLARGVMYRIRSAEGKKKHRWFIRPGTALGAVAAVLILLVGTGKIPLFDKSTDSAQPETEAAYRSITTEKAAGETAEAMSEDLMSIPEAALYGGVMVTNDTGGSIEEAQLERYRQLSADKTAAVLLYQGVGETFFEQLIAAEPDFSAAFAALSPTELSTEGCPVYRITYAKLMALQEWFSQVLSPADGEKADRLGGWERFAQTDPENDYLTTVIQKKKSYAGSRLPEQWGEQWGEQWLLEENWALLFPDEAYEPKAEDTAYIVLLPIE